MIVKQGKLEHSFRSWSQGGFTAFNGLRGNNFVAGTFYFVFSMRRIFFVVGTLLTYDILGL